MSDIIRANREAVSDRFPIVGFTIQTDASPKWFEIALATDASLLHPENKGKRTRSNFFSTRSQGPLAAPRGEAVYLVAMDVMAQFAGQARLYYALATFTDANRSSPLIAVWPTDRGPAITISNSFSARPLRRSYVGAPRNKPGITDTDLTWVGDASVPGTKPVEVKADAAKGAKSAASAYALGNQQRAGYTKQRAAVAAPASRAAEAEYDDGYGAWPEAAASDDDDNNKGIDQPIGDAAVAQSLGRAMDADTAEYPGASRFVAAKFFRHSTSPRTINRIVIHITDGGPKVTGTIGWFQNPIDVDKKTGEKKPRQVSAHYVVGQAGEVVQMVKNNDVAWHANSANTDSIGIEHVANKKTGIMPTQAEYCASAALTSWLCDQFGIPKDRDHILGHSEADPKTTHTDCPNSVWDWDYYMHLVTSGTCDAPESQPSESDDPQAATTSSLAFVRPNRKNRNGGSMKPVSKGLATVDMYDPSDGDDGKRRQAEFLRRKQAFTVGVGNTSFFPHSAICLLRIAGNDGNAYIGTGFYISANCILTAGHCVHDSKSIEVIPGNNGAGSSNTERPYGSFTVGPADWDQFAGSPGAAGDQSDDIAVIRTTTPPPGGGYFDYLEELLECKENPILVCGYAHVGDFKQHMDGDMIRTADGGMLTYNLQTLGGTSGSPVYYLDGYEDDQRQVSELQYRVVGVHTGAEGNNLNHGVALTAAKINWIRTTGQITNQSTAAPTVSQAYSTNTKSRWQAPPASRAMAAATASMPQKQNGSNGHGSGNGNGNGNGNRNAVSRAQGSPVESVVQIASEIVGALMTKFVLHGDDISYELDQLNGLKHVNNDAANRVPGGMKDYSISLSHDPVLQTISGKSLLPGMGNEYVDNYADFTIAYQADGRSVGNVSIRYGGGDTGFDTALKVVAKILNDDRVLTGNGGGPTFAAVKIVFTYVFHEANLPLGDRVYQRTITLFGDGTHEDRGAWTKSGV